VVFPALSRPRIKILTSLSPHNFENKELKRAPAGIPRKRRGLNET